MKRRFFLSLILTILCLTALAQVSKPVIGITTGFSNQMYTLRYTCVESVKEAGGIPFILPFVDNAEDARDYIARVDGLLLSGGADVDPVYYNEEPERALGSVDPDRDLAEMLYIEATKNANKPILAICRGSQILNVAFGGTLYQDISSSVRGAIKHGQSQPGKFPSHSISIAKDSYLYQLIGLEEVRVNSFHHQAVKDIAPDFKVTAYAPDGVVEAYEGFPKWDVLAIQSHPEYFVADNHDPLWLKIFTDLIDRANKKR